MSRPSPAVVLTVLLVAVTIPHAAEDFTFGEFASRGVPTPLAAVALVTVYALQALGIALAMRGSLAGFRLLAATGAVWCAGAIAFHGGEILANGAYRYGAVSKGLEVAIIALGAATALSALVALAGRRR
jgi:hypothetical protein